MKKILIIPILIVLFSFTEVVFAQTSTESGDIREKVQEKVLAALNKPKAYMGTVTDISETTLQLKNMKGEIKQISVKEDVSVVNIISTSKEVKFSDVAIGDFVIAMGFVNTNSVLDTRRILVTSSPTAPTRKSYYAKIDTFAKNAGTATLIKDGSKINFTTSSATKYQMMDEEEITQAKSSSVKTSSKVVISGIEELNVFKARRILVIQ